ncbi:MAG: carboxylating nicotinate-nucleotide diphosphorylase [Alphaproteobacteria bacterium]|nr:carboxylating nicotinate-nucleotide diphosphorylase [Alphaproteobacteria bacterium]
MTSQTNIAPLPSHLIEAVVNSALSEDLGVAGDITTNATVAPIQTAVAEIIAREAGVVSGVDLAAAAFRALDPAAIVTHDVQDGEAVEKGDRIATVSGQARAILSAERVALNFAGHMSGIATLTRCYVNAVANTGATIVDTRKTTPGLRAVEKYAVRCGGGSNHRSGLFDAVLIKDNHIVAAGGLEAAIENAKQSAGHMVRIEVEVDTLDQLRRVLPHDVDALLLDNMTVEELESAVQLVDGHALTEASGGVTLETVSAIAATGVDLISVGALTHSAPTLDIGLDFQPRTA